VLTGLMVELDQMAPQVLQGHKVLPESLDLPVDQDEMERMEPAELMALPVLLALLVQWVNLDLTESLERSV